MSLFKRTYTTPPIDILQADLQGADNYRAFNLQPTLDAFGLDATLLSITAGATLITYDYLLNNISDFNPRQLQRVAAAISARYHTPVGIGKGLQGDFTIELTREDQKSITLKNALKNGGFQGSNRTTVILGFNNLNQPVLLDLVTAPHVLLAGTTGSGKSVLLNSLICSALYKLTPAKIRFVMIDPKQVELSLYTELPHLERPIVTTVNDAVNALRDICAEMDSRYKYLRRKGLKDITRTKIPHLFIVIDELADLMLTSKKAVETYIIRIAQLGRAAGVHLIIATQRPTTNIITGLIKANIPTKIALTVSNTHDSITILNHGGAEKLTGRGDAIIKYSDSIQETRFKAIYTPPDDINAIVRYYKTTRV